MNDFDEPTLSADDVLARLKMPRLRYAFAGFGGMTVALLVGSLWLTEPGTLPVRTHLAFGAIVAAGLGWALFAAWALSRRAPLFAYDRVVAGRLALAFSAVEGGAIVAIAAMRGDAATVLVAVVVGLVFVVAAALMLVHGRRRHAELLRHKEELRHRRS